MDELNDFGFSTVSETDFTATAKEPETKVVEAAVAEARQGDVLVVAGKGHEDYQILRTETIHFDDREEVRSAIAA